MIKRGQIRVRAKSPSGRWGKHDVLDLTDDSFKVWITYVLFRSGLVAGIKTEMMEGEEIELLSKVEEVEEA